MPTRRIVVSAGSSSRSAKPTGSPLSVAMTLPWRRPVAPARAGRNARNSRVMKTAKARALARAGIAGIATSSGRPIPSLPWSVHADDLATALQAVREHLVEVHTARHVTRRLPLQRVLAGRHLAVRERLDEAAIGREQLHRDATRRG